MILLIDFHGTLTDGKLNISHDGTIFESCCVRDVRAIREFIASGWEVYIVTQSSSKIIEAFARKVGCEIIVARDKTQVVPNLPYTMVGDDVSDIPLLEKAERAFCPQDADRAVLMKCDIGLLKSKGGTGVIAELARMLL